MILFRRKYGRFHMAETRITIKQFQDVLHDKLIKHGAGEEEARKVSEIFALNAADGVMSHSVLRVKRMIGHYDCGIIIPGNKPVLVSGKGAVERYDANKCTGVIAASICMDRACEIAKKFGIGMVALRNANHWMRGGYYGWLAADKGLVGICWTNTRQNLPSWGSLECNIGNNPFVMAVPGKDGQNFVLDCAMSQFSNGKLEVTRRAGKKLPVAGGYDQNGELTTNPGDIENTRRALPMGFWKGSSMSILLDAAAAMLADGNDSAAIERHMQADNVDESDLCQVFIAIDPEVLGENGFAEVEKSIKASVHEAKPVVEGSPSRYPGERVLKDRAKAMAEGIMVSTDAWDDIQAL